MPGACIHGVRILLDIEINFVRILSLTINETDLITSSPFSQEYHGVSIGSLSLLMESLVEVTGTTASVSPLKSKEKTPLKNCSDDQTSDARSEIEYNRNK